MIAFIPVDVSLDDILRQRNDAVPHIQLTCEEEVDDKLPFLDMVIRKSAHGLKFSVYRKPTNKDDFIHYFSAHSMRTKTGVVIGFFLRAYRICSPEFLQDELAYIKEAFMRLKFPESLLITLQEKAKKIKDKVASQTDPEEPKKTTYLVAPNSQQAEKVAKQLAPELRMVTVSGKKIGQAIRKRRSQQANPDSIVYKIPCGQCDKAYFGETGRGLHTRLKEHKNDLRNHRMSKAIVIHADHDGHLPKWDGARALHSNLTKMQRWLIEAAYISTEDVTNVSSGFFKLAGSISEQIKNENRH